MSVHTQHGNELRIANFYALHLKANGIFDGPIQVINTGIVPFEEKKNHAFDVQISMATRISVEMKWDDESAELRNLFLEVHNSHRNEPSGLNATKATVWLQYAPRDRIIFEFNPKDMLKHLEEHKSEYKFVKKGGDKNSDGYCLPIATALKLPFVNTIEASLEP